MHVRPAVPEDTPGIKALLPLPEERKVLETVKGVLSGSLTEHRVVLAFSDADEGPVGLLLSKRTEGAGGSVIEVLRMVIAPDWFGRGVGAALLENERVHASGSGAGLLRVS